MKKISIQIITWLITFLCFLIVGLLIPILLKIEMPLMFLFSWVAAPVLSVILCTLTLKRLNINKFNTYISISFIINFIILLIYTYYESLAPHVDGNFMDFRGIVFLVYGLGQVIGLIVIFLKRRW